MPKSPKKKGALIKPRKKNTKLKIGDTSKPDLSLEEEARWKEHFAKRAKDRRKRDRKDFKVDGMVIRMRILHASLYIERTVEDLVVDLLNITDQGRKEMRWSFERKIWILAAMNLLNKDERKLFDSFRLVRNSFIHDLKVNSYSALYAKHPELKKIASDLVNEEVTKFPFNLEGTEEENLDLGTRILTDRVPQICDRVKKEAVDRFKKKVGGEIFEIVYKRTREELAGEDNPFKKAVENIDREILIRYSKSDVKNVIQRLFTEVSMVFQRVAKEEKEAYLKKKRKEGPPKSGPIL